MVTPSASPAACPAKGPPAAPLQRSAARSVARHAARPPTRSTPRHGATTPSPSRPRWNTRASTSSPSAQRVDLQAASTECHPPRRLRCTSTSASPRSAPSPRLLVRRPPARLGPRRGMEQRTHLHHGHAGTRGMRRPRSASTSSPSAQRVDLHAAGTEGRPPRRSRRSRSAARRPPPRHAAHHPPPRLRSGAHGAPYHARSAHVARTAARASRMHVHGGPGSRRERAHAA